MFNLDEALARWRGEMLACGFKSIQALEELEAHLRDDIEAQVHSGVKEQRAFELAVQRLGAPAELKEEFNKSRLAGAAQGGKLLGYFYFICAGAAILIDLWTLTRINLGLAGRAGVVGGVALFALYLFGLPFWLESTNARAGAGFIKALKIVGLIVPLWVFFALLSVLLPNRWEVGIIPEMTMWSLCAAYGLTALAWAAGSYGPGSTGGSFPPLTPQPIAPLPLLPPYLDRAFPPGAMFTPEARQALEVARNEALGLGHHFIGTEHVLLGLLETSGGALTQAFQISSEAVRTEVARLISAVPARPAPPQLRLTPRARKALQLGWEAAASKSSPVGTLHLLLGLLREGSGVAAIALRNLGIQPDKLRTGFPRD